MIEFSRALARTFRTVLKKISNLSGRRDPPTFVVFRTDRAGLHIQAKNSQIAVEYSQPGMFTQEEIVLLADALKEFEAAKDSPVRMGLENGGVVVTWQDKAVPQVRQFDIVANDRVPAMPASPKRMERQPAKLIQALHDASLTASTDAIRYATNCIQLRGRQGQIVGTDGKQLLVQGGFSLPWAEDVLIPASAVFGCRELHEQEPVAIGKTEEHVSITAGPWTFYFAVEKNARFPTVDSIIPSGKQNGTMLQLDPADSEFALGTLDSLPGASDDESPVTVEGNGHIALRASGENQPAPTEVVLARSQVQGRQISFATNRAYLVRALQLGFTHIGVSGVDRPVVCRDDNRHYVWQPLPKESVVRASDDGVHLSSLDSQASTPVTTNGHSRLPTTALLEDEESSTVKEPVTSTAPQPAPVAQASHERSGMAAVLEEAEAIKDLLRDAYTRTHQLITGIKRYRKQAQVVRSALGSLRQLQEVAE